MSNDEIDLTFSDFIRTGQENDSKDKDIHTDDIHMS